MSELGHIPHINDARSERLYHRRRGLSARDRALELAGQAHWQRGARMDAEALAAQQARERPVEAAQATQAVEVGSGSEGFGKRVERLEGRVETIQGTLAQVVGSLKEILRARR